MFKLAEAVQAHHIAFVEQVRKTLTEEFDTLDQRDLVELACELITKFPAINWTEFLADTVLLAGAQSAEEERERIDTRFVKLYLGFLPPADKQKIYTQLRLAITDYSRQMHSDFRLNGKNQPLYRVNFEAPVSYEFTCSETGSTVFIEMQPSDLPRVA